MTYSANHDDISGRVVFSRLERERVEKARIEKSNEKINDQMNSSSEKECAVACRQNPMLADNVIRVSGKARH